MIKLCLDSSVIIDFIRRPDKRKTVLFSLSETQQYSIYTSIIVHAEIYSGKSVWEKPQAKKELTTIFSGIELLPLEIQISEKAGEMRAKYGVHLFDALIAATAIHHNLELVTLNIKDFEKIPDLKLFKTPFPSDLG